MNRMNDTILSARVTGTIEIDGQNIYDRDLDVVQLRARVGMVFQKANPFAKSIYENVAYGPRIHGLGRSRPISTRSSRNRPQGGAVGRGGEGPPHAAGHRSPAGSSSASASPGRSPSTPR